MKNIHSIAIILLFLAFTACQKESNTAIEEGIIYVSSVTNPSTQEPFHEVWIQKKDTLWKHDFWKNEKNFTTTQLKNLSKKDKLVFKNEDTLWLAPKFTLYENLHVFINKQEFRTYVEIPKGQTIQAKEFTKLVENRVFETSISNLKTPNSAFRIQEKIHFSANKITYFWEYYYADELMHTETEIVELSYFEVENQLFIIPATPKNPYPIYQVVKAEKNEIELAYFTDFERKIKTYKSTDEVNPNYSATYRLCKDSFQSLYYVGEDVRYAKGLDHLLLYLQQDAPKTDGDGFINIHFTINCNGEVGRLGLELLDRTYQPKDFDPEIIQHIVDKVKQINDWDNVEKIDYMGAKDAKSFLLIQVANQQIVEVCP